MLNEFGEYTGETATREECVEKGLWHKDSCVYILSKDNKNILLQKRSPEKRPWPNMWDVSVGGHVNAGELGTHAIIRELKEELGIDVKKEDLEFVGCATNIGKHKHYNEFYAIHVEIDPQILELQKEEVQGVKWFQIEEVKKMAYNNYDGITPKVCCWNHLFNYIKIQNKV